MNGSQISAIIFLVLGLSAAVFMVLYAVLTTVWADEIKVEKRVKKIGTRQESNDFKNKKKIQRKTLKEN